MQFSAYGGLSIGQGAKCKGPVIVRWISVQQGLGLIIKTVAKEPSFRGKDLSKLLTGV